MGVGDARVFRTGARGARNVLDLFLRAKLKGEIESREELFVKYFSFGFGSGAGWGCKRELFGEGEGANIVKSFLSRYSTFNSQSLFLHRSPRSFAFFFPLLFLKKSFLPDKVFAGRGRESQQVSFPFPSHKICRSLLLIFASPVPPPITYRLPTAKTLHGPGGRGRSGSLGPSR